MAMAWYVVKPQPASLASIWPAFLFWSEHACRKVSFSPGATANRAVIVSANTSPSALNTAMVFPCLLSSAQDGTDEPLQAA